MTKILKLTYTFSALCMIMHSFHAKSIPIRETEGESGHPTLVRRNAANSESQLTETTNARSRGETRRSNHRHRPPSGNRGYRSRARPRIDRGEIQSLSDSAARHPVTSAVRGVISPQLTISDPETPRSAPPTVPTTPQSTLSTPHALPAPVSREPSFPGR